MYGQNSGGAHTVVNFYQTGIHCIPVSDWTMAEEGLKHVELAGKDNKKITNRCF